MICVIMNMKENELCAIVCISALVLGFLIEVIYFTWFYKQKGGI